MAVFCATLGDFGAGSAARCSTLLQSVERKGRIWGWNDGLARLVVKGEAARRVD